MQVYEKIKQNCWDESLMMLINQQLQSCENVKEDSHKSGTVRQKINEKFRLWSESLWWLVCPNTAKRMLVSQRFAIT